MDKLFLDANILFSAAYQENSGVSKIWALKGVQLFTSYYALEEAGRNLEGLSQNSRLEKLISRLQICSCYDDALIPKQIKLRQKDRPILAAAIELKVDYLITGDFRDFGIFFNRKIAGVLVLPPAEYLVKLTDQAAGKLKNIKDFLPLAEEPALENE